MVTACGGHSKSATSAMAPAAFSSVGDQVKDDAGVAVEELDAKLHVRVERMARGLNARTVAPEGEASCSPFFSAVGFHHANTPGEGWPPDYLACLSPFLTQPNLFRQGRSLG
jgi:hypothetical protein